ncbi:MAG: flagellar motor switch protein FliM [Rickettsiales bacterium]|nr:MAG: flagellar motor switch protein FliM [Rickettsiales bacterium]
MAEKEKKPDDKETKNKNNNNDDAHGSGVKEMLEQSLQSYDKLPMLEIIFEKFIRKLSTAFRNFTSEPMNISISESTSMRFGNYFESLKNPSSIVVFKAVEWDNLGLLILENDMVFSFVDLLLGGKKNTVQNKKEDKERILTSIEQGLARQIAELTLLELGQSFDQVTPTTFAFDRLEINPSFATIARPGDAIIVLKIKVEVDEQVKNLELVIPYKTIEPVKEQMQQIFLGDKFGADHEWEDMLSDSIYGVELPIEVIINNKTSTVEEICKLKIGDTIVMDHAEDKDVIVRSGQIPIFTGKIGKVDNKVAINLKNLYEE